MEVLLAGDFSIMWRNFWKLISCFKKTCQLHWLVRLNFSPQLYCYVYLLFGELS